jgi:hypothetical protein
MSMAWRWSEHYTDQSTDQGFQFKFTCERCGDAYPSTFKPNTVATINSLLRGAGELLGGFFSDASRATSQIGGTLAGPQKDAALKEAIAEVEPRFGKCSRCGNWMCRKSCYNAAKRMCKTCAPVGKEEESALRDHHVREQVANDLAVEEEHRLAARKKEAAAACPDCGAATLGKKFCPGCGKKLAAAASAFCGECGAKMTPGSKFCGECGAKGG